MSRSAFLQWKAADPDLARRYEAAQLMHAESLVDECLELADDLGRMEGGGAMARLKVARLYFKRHDAAADRRAREEEHQAQQHATAPEEAPSEPPAAEKEAPAPTHFPAPAPARPIAAAAAAVVSEPEAEPQLRYAGARR